MDHEINGRGNIQSLRDEVTELGRSLRSSLRFNVSSFRSTSSGGGLVDEETALQWAAFERLPTFTKLRSSLFIDSNDNEGKRKRVVDVTKLSALERQLLIDNLIKHIENDNIRLLRKIKKRFDKVGIKLPTVEVRYENLHVDAECQVVDGKPLPTLWNSLKIIFLGLVRLLGLKPEMSKIHIIDGVSGIITPGRMTLLLGPPGSGKTSLLKALFGNLDKSLKTTGEVCYNGYRLKEFVPQKTCAYISQYDVHIPEMTVRETLDFSSYCQGVGGKEEIIAELSRREKLAGIVPDPDIDTYMKATSVEGRKAKLQTDYIAKILGLDICADTMVGDANRRGISGGQKKRLTTGELMVGPMKTLFMDEISNGLDSSTTHQIITCLQHLAHITDATIFVSLLQPAPEVFDLFDDIVLLAEGKIVYHGPRENVLEFFESCGFRCPERKGIADFMQEVISEKDQGQYWYGSTDTYTYHSVKMLSTKFKESVYGKKLEERISAPLAKSQDHRDAISFGAYSLPRWSMLKACFTREFLLMRRSSFVYVFKAIQLVILASITMTVFLRTRMEQTDLIHANYYVGALFYSLVVFLVDGLPEASLTIGRLAGFYKQRDLHFYPSWAYAIPSIMLKIPLSMLAAFIWTSLTYFVIGYSADVSRFFQHLILLFSVHFTSMSMFRFLGSVSQTLNASSASANLALIVCFLFGGFVISRSTMPIWLRWGFWISPLTYGEIGLAVNEFSSPRWNKVLPSNITVGREILESRGLNFNGYASWIALGALFSFSLLFNLGYVLALTFLRPPTSHTIISREKFSRTNNQNELSNELKKKNSTNVFPSTSLLGAVKGRMQLHFEPLTVVFQDLQYYVETPSEMKERGFAHNKLQLLQDMTGTFRPGSLTALMGVSGAGKTTLFDVLAGRKTVGTIEGEINIGGYPKVQKTYARSLGYCEQNDIHSPNITVEESLAFSAWLRLNSTIDFETRTNFVREVLETVELEAIKDSVVGIPGVSGLSTEERKRLTVAVELVANPSIIFLDEPTTGLDARAAAIVMRAVKRVADTGRTIVCTIHQPSIHIFEAFDELILLKSGGRMIYNGPLGFHSSEIIKYFESVSGVRKIRRNFNPATWVLEVTSTSLEAEFGVDFAEIYKNSTLYQHNKELAKIYSSPTSESKALGFSSTDSQNSWGQFKACLWKQYWSYWRSPSYNLRRIIAVFLLSLLQGALFFNQGRKIHNQQSLFSTIGSMYTAVIFCGINNTLAVMPYVSVERQVFYRERFSGMYSIWAYSLAQGVMEIPYAFIQTMIVTCITYPMIGYHLSAFKVFFYFYTVFCTLLSFIYLGMMIVSITPNYQVAAIVQSSFYSMFYLFSGFLVPPQHIPKWWMWMYYLVPTSWSLRGLATSQFGDIHENIEVFGETKTVADFLRDYFGYHQNQLPLTAVVMLAFPIYLVTVYAYCLGNMKFLRR